METNNDKVFYILKCITNLHVGSGDSGFSIVDKQVERDEMTGYPMIYSSSLKGALREYLTRMLDDIPIVENIFGGEGKVEKAGKVKFFDANLLAIPMRASQGGKTFYMVTTKRMLEQFITFLRLSGHDIGDLTLNGLSDETQVICKNETGNIGVEGIEATESEYVNLELETLLKKIGLENLIILSDKDFKECSLPVRARNNLNENTRNLWYEEHVPYNSIFYTMMMETGEDQSDKALENLKTMIDDQMIQVGANATVGFGLVKFKQWEGV